MWNVKAISVELVNYTNNQHAEKDNVQISFLWELKRSLPLWSWNINDSIHLFTQFFGLVTGGFWVVGGFTGSGSSPR